MWLVRGLEIIYFQLVKSYLNAGYWLRFQIFVYFRPSSKWRRDSLRKTHFQRKVRLRMFLLREFSGELDKEIIEYWKQKQDLENPLGLPPHSLNYIWQAVSTVSLATPPRLAVAKRYFIDQATDEIENDFDPDDIVPQIWENFKNQNPIDSENALMTFCKTLLYELSPNQLDRDFGWDDNLDTMLPIPAEGSQKRQFPSHEPEKTL